MPELVAFPPWPASIHAPARGATLRRLPSSGDAQLQSTLPHGERPSPNQAPKCHHWLQSTLPHGERRECRAVGLNSAALQSTLPHGERQWRVRLFVKLAGFNPRSRTGSDSGVLSLATVQNGLQSTLPHGERPTAASQAVQIINASIHAPARGATEPAAPLAPDNRGFNPRSRTGSDLRGLPVMRMHIRASIHAPARGATVAV